MRLGLPDRRHCSRRGIAGRSRGRDGFGGGIWRLLACTEGSRDTQEEEADTGTDDNEHEKRHERRHHRRHHQRRKQNPDSEGRHKCGQQDASSMDEFTGASSCSSIDRRRRRLNQRRSERHVASGDASGDASKSQLQPPRTTSDKAVDAAGDSQSPPSEGRKRRKRLVVAMLEDQGDEDRATAQGTAASETRKATGRSGVTGVARLRATRNERSIRRILQQLSVTLDAADNQLPELATSEIPNFSAHRTPQKSPTAAAAATSRTMTVQPSPTVRLQSLPASARPPSLQQPPPLPPRSPMHPPKVAPSTTATVHNMAQRQQQQQHQQQQKQQQQHPKGNEQKADYIVCECEQPSVAESALRGSGRRGYRLFRRVFSASDNYYAVPFPPLENIKLNEDDDQWEDLEIYVASHKGMVSLKPKPGKQKRQTAPEASVSRQLQVEMSQQPPPARGKASGIPRPTMPAPGRKQPPQKPQRLKPESASLRRCQLLRASGASAAAAAAGDQPERSRQLQSSLKPPQHESRNLRASQQPPEASPTKAQFGYKMQQQQTVLQTQQRRADPLSPSRLLSQLRQGEPAGRPTKLTPPTMAGSARNSQLPRCRWEPPPAAADSPSGNNRYARLTARLP